MASSKSKHVAMFP